MIDGTTATTLDPSVLSIGNHTVTYSFTDVNGCSNTATQTVTINALPTVSITGLNANYCKNATAVTLVGTPTGGSFMIDATAATTLDPSVLSVGNHTVTYSFTDVNGCSNTASQSVTINANCGADSDCDGVVDALDICPGGDDKIDNNHDGKPDCRYFVQINQLINAWKCGNNGNKVVICHIPSGNPKNRQTLCVDVSALAAHLGHGDYIGSCNNATCTPNSVDNFVLEGHAQAAIDHTLIGWTSNLGSKIDYFVIQKQNVQNTDFETLATVNNTHFSDDFQHTTFSDMQPTEGDNIYRIKTILNGGLEKYSALMKVKFSNPAYAQISPNPSDGLVDILLNTPVGLSVMIKVYNAFGHEIQEIKSTERLIHLDLSDFTSGLYLLRISQNGKRDFTKQIVIQK